MATDPASLARGLAAILHEALGGPVDVVDLRRLPGGASRLTWSFDAVPAGGGATVPLIFQQERAGGTRTNAGIAVEAGLLRAAKAREVPVADVVVADGDPAASVDGVDLGLPWQIMRRLAGETVPRRILRDDGLTDARRRVAGQCGAALAAIHGIDPADAPGLASHDRLEQYRSLLAELGEPHPAFELGLRWLDAHRPDPPPRLSVVHGDFRNGNLIIDGDGLRAVLDWELAHLGDPVEDLGWFCVRAWRFGSAQPAGGFGSREQLIDAYEAAGGQHVDADALHWWEVMGTLTWGVICMIQVASHRLGLSRSVELAAIGRRVCETEHDLLVLLPPGSSDARRRGSATVATEHATLHDVPTAPELVEAVREFLESDVMASTEGRVKFHTRVAVNVLSMVERELSLGPVQAEQHGARLQALGFADEAELSAAVRDGRLDARWDEVKAAVWETVDAKLAVANPTYAEEPRQAE